MAATLDWDKGYVQIVADYYRTVTPYYRRGWSESFHFAPFKDGEDVRTAVKNHECWLVGFAGLTPEHRVLDIGCGIGGPAWTVAEHSGASVTGLNISQLQLEIASAKARKSRVAQRLSFVAGDGTYLPFRDESFDAVMMLEAMCYFPDKQAICREIFRVLRRGGVFVEQDWLETPSLDPDARAEFIAPICRHHRLPGITDLPTICSYLENAGFKVDTAADLKSLGNMKPNFDKLTKNKPLIALHKFNRKLVPKTIRMLVDGGLALQRGIANDTFMIGYLRAYKPK